MEEWRYWDYWGIGSENGKEGIDLRFSKDLNYNRGSRNKMKGENLFDLTISWILRAKGVRWHKLSVDESENSDIVKSRKFFDGLSTYY